MRNYFLDLDQVMELVMELVMDSWPGLGEGHQTAGQGDRGSGGNNGGEERSTINHHADFHQKNRQNRNLSRYLYL